MLQLKIYGLECCQILEDCFWNIDDIRNGNSLLAAEDSGKAGFALSTGKIPPLQFAYQSFKAMCDLQLSVKKCFYD